jgi:hypothetical protein
VTEIAVHIINSPTLLNNGRGNRGDVIYGRQFRAFFFSAGC